MRHSSLVAGTARTGETETRPSIREAPMPGYMPTASSRDSSRQQNTRWYGLSPSAPVHCDPDRMIRALLGWSGTGGSSALTAPKTMRFKLACSLSIWLSRIASSASMLSAMAASTRPACTRAAARRDGSARASAARV